MMISFQCHGRSIELPPGEHYARPRDVGFRDTSAQDLVSLVSEMQAGSPWRRLVADRYATANPWLYKIVADSSRTAFFDPVIPPSTGPALEIGSGWGQIARPLAVNRPVVALEPVAERMAFIQAAARQDGVDHNLTYIESDYLEADFNTRFDLICAIGVLEWMGAFQDQCEPRQRQRQFLAKTRRELTPEGTLVLGIENRLGLKYLLGCTDDHIGVPHIACLPADLAMARWAEQGGTLQSFTYSQAELTQLLHEAGFSHLEFFAAFPDYKLPASIISLSDQGKALDQWLLTEPLTGEHNGYDGSALNPGLQNLLTATYLGLARQGAARHFVPSFFVRAS